MTRAERRKKMKRKLVILSIIGLLVLFTAICFAQPKKPAPAVKGAAPGAFVDPETKWRPGRTGQLPEGAPTFGVGFLADLSGTLGFWNAPRLVGATGAYEWICKHEYGIAGRRPILRWYDHKSSASEAKAGYAKLRLKYIVNHSCGTGEQQMLKPNYDPDKFLTLTCSLSPNVMYPVGYAFGMGPYFPSQYAAFIDYITKDWDYKKMGRGPRVAYITYPSGYGRAFITTEAEAYAKKKGVEKVADIATPWAPPDPESMLAAAKQAGAEFVFTNAMYATMGPLLKANYEGKYGLQFCVNNLSLDDATISRAGKTGDKWNAEGLLGGANISLPDDPGKGMDLLRKYWEEHFVKPEDRCASYIQAWLEAFTWKEAIEQTLVRVKSWDKVTSREVRLTLEGPDWDGRNIRDMITYNFSPTSREPLVVRIAEVKGGKWIPVTSNFNVPQLVPEEWRKPWKD
jgi:ABC-type branched-subunit amino acid transport system substrate-binding protein